MENNHLLKLEVYLTPASNKPVLVRELWLHPDISVPFNKISETMRFLFGVQCVVVFNSSIV